MNRVRQGPLALFPLHLGATLAASSMCAAEGLR